MIHFRWTFNLMCEFSGRLKKKTKSAKEPQKLKIRKTIIRNKKRKIKICQNVNARKNV